MAGLNHDFFLLSRSETPYSDFMNWINHSAAIHIHDDLLGYISDTLKWVECYNPGNKMMKGNGLNWYGPSIVKQDGAVKLKEVFEKWASPLASSPATLQLKGNFTWNEDQTNGVFETLIYDRDEIIRTFRTLAIYAKKVVDSQDDFYILHLGI